MSDPYVQPSLSGYNASPPADDGTAVTANALKWSKHISKIGDPLKTYSQAIDANLVTAFGKIFGHNVATKSGNYTIVSADQGLFIEVTATATITLLPAATAGSNFPLVIVNTGSGIVTVDGNASETINGSTTITLNADEALVITCNATKWIGFVVNAAFADPNSITVKTKSADESATSDTDFSDDTHMLDYLLEANTLYRVSGFLKVNTGGSATPDIKMQFVTDNAFVEEFCKYHSITTNSNISGISKALTAITTIQVFSGQQSGITIEGFVLTHATLASNVDFQWAQAISDSTPTVIEKGSFIAFQKIG